MSGIVWSEGMFIAPQHFQRADLAARAYAEAIASLDLFGNDFGVSELDLNSEHLKLGKIGVRTCNGVFPDRTYFDLSKELVLDIPDGTVDTIVALCLPVATRGTKQIGTERGAHRYLSERAELEDIQDPENESMEANIWQVGVDLRLLQGDMSAFAVIPICRILEKTAEGRVALDRQYMPRALRISASDRLLERLDELVTLARVRAGNAASRLATEQNARSAFSLLREQLELQILNRHLVNLQYANQHKTESPRVIYLQMAALNAELDALDARSVNTELVFDAANPTDSFQRLTSELRRKLTLEKAASVMSLTWNEELFETRRLLRLVIPARVLAEKRRPILAVSSDLSPGVLADLVPKACKLAGLSSMPELVTHGLAGVKLTPMATAPSELRDRSDAAFFTIDTSSPHWKRMLDQREAFAMHVDERIGKLDSILYLLD